jgi:hypothetical protein
MEITNENNMSSYIWNFNKSYNVIGLKLMSYSLPIPRFNIMNKNNKLILNFNDNNIQVDIPVGKYTIDELVELLNKKIKEKEDTMNFSINSQQHIIIESTVESNTFSIIPTNLSKYNLGFISNDSKNKHISENTWDLRIDDKVYLFLKNISEELPFGVLHFNGQSVCQFKFENPYKLDKLEIVFKDSKGENYDFHNLSHSLNIMLDVYN